MATTTWNIDSTHSSIDFSVKHLGVFTVRGSLGAISGTAETTDDVLTGLSLSIDATGITTNHEQRDAHLKSADFLNVEQNPTFTFVGTSIVKTGDAEYSVTGDLTINGTTAPTTVEVEVVPPVTDPWGNNRAGANGKGTLLRSAHGVTYNAVLETGHLMISDEIKFTFDIQGVSV